MRTITDDEFKKLLNSKDTMLELEGHTINLTNPVEIDLSNKDIVFINCSFNGDSYIVFKDFTASEEDVIPINSLAFDNCNIGCSITIDKCRLGYLTFTNVKSTARHLHIVRANIGEITFISDDDEASVIQNLMFSLATVGELQLLSCEFTSYLGFSGCDIQRLRVSQDKIERCDISNCQIDELHFWKNVLAGDSHISKNTFNSFEVPSSNFGRSCDFYNNVFKGNCDFQRLESAKSRIEFTQCNFEKYTYFDDSSFGELSFDLAFFNETVSFQNITCNTIKFNRTHFDKVAFFNDMAIAKPNSCDLKTIRIIKNQLSKTENGMDYLRYNAVEHNNLLLTIKGLTSDKILLLLNKMSNHFGTDWARGIMFTFTTGLFFFLLLLFVNTGMDSNYPYSFNPSYAIAPFSESLGAYLKFMFSFGFKNDELQDNGWMYLIFIVGKIFIGYGIYQTISAFRKFGKT
jgi:hypothetical protein